MEIISLCPSTRRNKRFMITYQLTNGKTKRTHFGNKYNTYIDTQDKWSRDRFWQRYHSYLEFDNYTNPSYWIGHLLYGCSNNIYENLKIYKTLYLNEDWTNLK